jgi:hypothetical protein
MLACLMACSSMVWAAPRADSKKEALQDEEGKPPEYNTIVLQGLNKVTGHISRLEGPLGTVLRFDNLEIIARRCWKAPPEEQPENAALLDISELKSGEGPAQIFLGWMFSSSPGLSGLEHPVYDITVLSCEVRDEPEKDDKVDEPKPEKKSEKKKP